MSTIRDFRTWVTATQRGEDLAVELRGSAAYTDDGRTVTASVSVPADAPELEQIRTALALLTTRLAPQIERATTLAAADALTVAARFGELK